MERREWEGRRGRVGTKQASRGGKDGSCIGEELGGDTVGNAFVARRKCARKADRGGI